MQYKKQNYVLITMNLSWVTLHKGTGYVKNIQNTNPSVSPNHDSCKTIFYGMNVEIIEHLFNKKF